MHTVRNSSHHGGCTCSGGCTWSWGVYLPGGVPGPLECTYPGGVPARGVYLVPGVPALVLPPMNRMTDRCKNTRFATLLRTSRLPTVGVVVTATRCQYQGRRVGIPGLMSGRVGIHTHLSPPHLLVYLLPLSPFWYTHPLGHTHPLTSEGTWDQAYSPPSPVDRMTACGW